MKVDALKALNTPWDGARESQVENQDFYQPASIKVPFPVVSMGMTGAGGSGRSLDFHSHLEVSPLWQGITGDLMKSLDFYHH